MLRRSPAGARRATLTTTMSARNASSATDNTAILALNRSCHAIGGYGLRPDARAFGALMGLRFRDVGGRYVRSCSAGQRGRTPHDVPPLHGAERGVGNFARGRGGMGNYPVVG